LRVVFVDTGFRTRFAACLNPKRRLMSRTGKVVCFSVFERVDILIS